VLLGVLWLKGRRRSVAWTAAVMVGASATTTLLKLAFHRNRPQWVDPVHALTSFSFPSGHASGIASGMGVVVVLTLIYVRAAAVRRGLLALAAILVIVVGTDRILLGVHNVSDLIAGYAVGGFWVLILLALNPPEPQPGAELTSRQGGLQGCVRGRRRGREPP